MEDHYDDCGDDLFSLHDTDTVGLACRHCFDSDDDLLTRTTIAASWPNSGIMFSAVQWTMTRLQRHSRAELPREGPMRELPPRVCQHALDADTSAPETIGSILVR